MLVTSLINNFGITVQNGNTNKANDLATGLHRNKDHS